MKHKPRLNESMARLPGFADIHLLQPQSSVQGAFELIAELSRWLMVLTGMEFVALPPRAGAQGEACGLMVIKAAIAAKGEAQSRNIVLVPQLAHGTNPASAAGAGFAVRSVPARADGTIDPAEVKCRLGPDVAAIMLTYPNTCGLFEKMSSKSPAWCIRPAPIFIAMEQTSTPSWARRARAISALMLCISIFTRPSRLRMVVADQELVRSCFHPSSRLSRRCPYCREETGFRLVEQQSEAPKSFGRIGAFHGQMGMFVRALTYMLSHGANGLRHVAEDSVLTANYVRACLKDLMSQPFGERTCMHEALFDETWLRPFGLTTLDFAKAMIDEGLHPTIYFPLVAHGAMLIEPTESESKASLDLFIAALRDLALAAKSGEKERFVGAPFYPPRRRLDETRARNSVLKWTKPQLTAGG